MTYSEFRRNLMEMDMPVHKFAELIGVTHQSISNYSKKGQLPKNLGIIVKLMIELRRNGMETDCIVSVIQGVVLDYQPEPRPSWTSLNDLPPTEVDFLVDRPDVLDTALDDGYRAMAADKAREAEAQGCAKPPT